MKRAVLKVVENFPEIHSKLGLVLNATSLTLNDEETLKVGVAEGDSVGGARGKVLEPHAQEVEKDVAHDQEAGKGVAEGLEEELLLSDQVMDTLVHDLSEFLLVSL